MSARASIRNALVDKVKQELTAANKDKYYTDIDMNVSGRNLFIDQIEEFPAIGIGLGPERIEYQPSGFRWIYLTLYIRLYVRSEDSSDENLELLIEDIKTLIDNFEDLHYTITKPNGDVVDKKVTQMTLLDINTDEGVLLPNGIGEIRTELRYSDRNARI